MEKVAENVFASDGSPLDSNTLGVSGQAQED